MEVSKDNEVKTNPFQFAVFNPSFDLMIPEYSEVENRGGWINYGENNLFPQYLVGLMNRSARHSAILKTKASMIGGGGFYKDDASVEYINFLKNSRDIYDMDEILHRIAYDIEIFGGFFLNIIWSNDRSKISQISYIDPIKVRISDCDKNGERGYKVSQDWGRTRKYPPVFYPAFSETKKQKASQILYVKEYRPGIEFYAQPEYLPAQNWIEMEWEISQYHLRNIKNGWAPSMSINFSTGIPSDEEMDIVIRRLENKYEGSYNTGKVLYTFSENKDDAPVFTPIMSNNNDENFLRLLDDIENGIYQGHRITNTSLFGVKTPGELGNTNEVLEYLAIFQTQYINNKQLLIEKIFNKILDINGIKDRCVISKYKLKLEPQLAVVDLISILEGTLPAEQKVALLQQLGYTEDVTNKLIPTKIIE